jgi:NitT/TauT family transport system permease protein
MGVTIVGAALLGIWQVGSSALNLKFWISNPIAIGTLAVSWMTGGYIWPHLQITLEEVAIGFVGGAVLAFVAAFSAFTWPGAFAVVDPYLRALYTVPKLALAPMLIVVFGIGIGSKVALVVVTTTFICFYQCLSGLQSVPQDLINQVRLMGAGKVDIHRYVLLPASRDWVVLSLRLALPNAVAAALVGEMIASNRGLGFVTLYQADTFNTTGVFTAIIYVLVLVVPLYYLLNARVGQGNSWDVGSMV